MTLSTCRLTNIAIRLNNAKKVIKTVHNISIKPINVKEPNKEKLYQDILNSINYIEQPYYYHLYK